MFRLFVALKPPHPMRLALLDAMGGVPGARWQDDEQLHLTLAFIGEVDRHQAEDIAAALGSVRHPPVHFALAGLGSFDSRDRIHSLWVGIAPQDEVRSLHAAILRALTRAGIRPEARAFLPHITIARFSRGHAPAGPIRAAQLTPAPIAGRCEHFILYESHMARKVRPIRPWSDTYSFELNPPPPGGGLAVHFMITPHARRSPALPVGSVL